jgi:osmoprotectant transport system permease protein
VVATATLAALVGGGGLGVIINEGFGQQDRPQIMAGGILVAALALVVEGVLALVQHLVTPGRGRRPGRATPSAADASPAMSAERDEDRAVSVS